MAWIKPFTRPGGERRWNVAERLWDPDRGCDRIVTVTCKTEADARRKRRELEAQREGGAATPPARALVRDLLDHWLADARRRVVPKTYDEYERSVRVRLGPAIGALPLAKLGPERIAEHLDWVRETAPSRTANGRDRMVQIHYQILGMAMRHWWKTHHLPTRVPIEDVTPPRAPEARSTQPPWDPEEIGLFLATAREHSRYFPLYLTAIGIGLREGELCGLARPDVDLLGGHLTVRRQLYRLYGPTVRDRGLIVKETKRGSGLRTIEFPRRLGGVFREVFRAQDEAMRQLGAAYSHVHRLGDGSSFHADLVFCQPDGKALWSGNVTQRDFPRVIRQAASLKPLQPIHFHDLRHLTTTYASQAGATPRELQHLLGQSDPDVGITAYAHYVPGKLGPVLDGLMERWLGPQEAGA